MKLVIDGAPRTKKNSRKHIRRAGKIVPIPSDAWRFWLNTARVFISSRERRPFPLFPDEALNCRAVFFRDARRGDAVGYYQGLADLLEKLQIVANDAQIVTWDGSRMALDRENPRVELELELAE